LKRENTIKSKNSVGYDYDINSGLSQLDTYTKTVSFKILLSFSLILLLMITQISSSVSLPLPVSPLQSAYGQTVEAGGRCNCIIDYMSSGHSNSSRTAVTIPGIKLLKNETYQSQTEGRLSSIVIKSAPLMGILVKDFSLGNFSSGTSATVALNTINIKPNESLGVSISGGTIPLATALRGQIVKADVNANGTLGEIKTVGNEPIQFSLNYSKTVKEPVLGVNKFLVNVKDPGYYLLLISLGYNSKSSSDISNTNNTFSSNNPANKQTKYPLIAVYETVLKLG